MFLKLASYSDRRTVYFYEVPRTGATLDFVHLQLLDFLLGHGHAALFRRAELKTLVDFHGNEVCFLD